MYRIIHLNGENKGRRQPVHRRHILAGSDLGCLLWIGDSTVAPRQAEFTADSGGVLIRSLDGALGILRVNGNTVTEARLAHGDRIEIGSRALRIEIPGPVTRARTARIAGLALIALLLLRPAWKAWKPAEPAPRPPMPPPGSTPGTLREDHARSTSALDEMESLDRRVEIARTPAPQEPPETARADDILREQHRRAEHLLAQARTALEQDRISEAHHLLEQLQTTVPSFVPAHAERARLYERQGNPGEAERHWFRVLRHGAVSPLFGEAADALNRLAVSDLPPGEARVLPEPRPIRAAETGVQGPRVRFARIDPVRFPGTVDYDELRVLRFALITRGGLPPQGRVSLDVRVFDRWMPSEQIHPTRAILNPQGRFSLPVAAWPEEGQTATISVVVPAGQRERLYRETGQRMEYAGFVARVFVEDMLHDEVARPASLQPLIDAPR